MQTLCPSNMLLSHFNLSEPAFPLTPHTEFFFEGGQRGEMLDALLYAILYSEGIITVTGEVGAGKTTLSRMLVERAPPQLEVIYLANPSIKKDELPAVLAQELAIETRFKRRSQIQRDLHHHLIDLHSQGKRVVLIVDEAHAMSPEALEEIRLITNLDTNRHKLLQVILFGQQELNTTLASLAMRPLRERITERFTVHPLNTQEVASYLSFRVTRAGGDGNLFGADSSALIAKHSLGLMRRVNILAEKAMLSAYCEGTQTIQIRHVHQACKEARFKSLKGSVITNLISTIWRRLLAPRLATS